MSFSKWTSPSGPHVPVSTPICSIGLPFCTAMLLINQSINQSINHLLLHNKDLKLTHFTLLTPVQYNNSL